MANYVRVAFAAGIAGYAGSILWGLAFGEITTGQLKSAAPFVLPLAVTGAFYAYHLDNVELQMRPSRLREVGWQTLLTGICALIAATASFGILLGDGNLPLDQIVLTGLIGAAAGASLGWSIPRAAAEAKYNPLTEAKEERLRTLEAAAHERFRDTAEAGAWLEQPNGALGNRSPKTAASDVEGFVHAMGLLQGPRAVVA
jgi:hypothetical protein